MLTPTTTDPDVPDVSDVTDITEAPPTAVVDDAPANDEPTVRAPLGRRFLTVWAGQSVSTLGSQMTALAVAVHLFVATGSMWWLAAFSALAVSPGLLVLPFSGLFDRLDRRRLMIVADVVAGAGPIVGLWLVVATDVGVTSLVLVTSISGLGNAIQMPAYQASIPALVDAGARDRANGLVQLQQAIALVIAPALATLLLSIGGLQLVFLVDLSTFAIGVLATLAVPFSSGAGASGAATSDGAAGVGDRAIDGWRWLCSSGRHLLRFIAAMAMVNFFLAFFNVGVLGLATVLGGTARAGWPMTVGGAAMVVGSLLVGARGLGADRVAVAVRAFVPIVIGIAVCAIRPTFGALLLGAVIALVAVPTANAAVSTMFHEQVPEQMQGRVFAVRSAMASISNPLGSLAAGGLAIWLASRAGAGDLGWLETLTGGGARTVPAGLLVVAAAGLAVVVGLLALRSGPRSRPIPTDSGTRTQSTA